MRNRVGDGATGVEEIETKKKRQFNKIVFKRKNVLWRLIMKENAFGKELTQEERRRDTYGHWWVEIGDESYGWWPERPLSGPVDTIKGVGGFLNGFNNANTSNSRDLDHGQMADEVFVMIVAKEDARTPEDIIKIIQDFAESYSAGWSYPARSPKYENCHTFQEQMIVKCDFFVEEELNILI